MQPEPSPEAVPLCEKYENRYGMLVQKRKEIPLNDPYFYNQRRLRP